MTIAQAQAKLEATMKRKLAAFQRGMAMSYNRHAAKPIYPGQEIICSQKAAEVSALADVNDAEADLLEASL